MRGGRGAEYRSEEHCPIPLKTSAFEIPCSTFDIQSARHANAIRLKAEGSILDEWKIKS